MRAPPPSPPFSSPFLPPKRSSANDPPPYFLFTSEPEPMQRRVIRKKCVFLSPLSPFPKAFRGPSFLCPFPPPSERSRASIGKEIDTVLFSPLSIPPLIMTSSSAFSPFPPHFPSGYASSQAIEGIKEHHPPSFPFPKRISRLLMVNFLPLFPPPPLPHQFRRLAEAV